MKRMNIILIAAIVTVLCAVAAVSGCTTPGASEDLKSKVVDSPNFNIEVIGVDGKTTTITFADIKALDFVKLDDVILVKSTGTTTTSDWIGPNMTKVLAKAGGIPAGDVTIMVNASDGYSKVYTAAQVNSAILALVENDVALTDNINKNSIRMIVPGEPGDMWMKCPTKITIVTGTFAAQPLALNITGKVNTIKKMTLGDLRANPIVKYSVAYKDNTTLAGDGISLNKLLDKAVIKADATGIKFIASDGYNKTVSLADVRASIDAVIAFNDDGTLRVIIPGQPFNTWVSKLVEIEVV